MARISIRIFVDDAEFDRVDADLPAEATRDIVDGCKQVVEENKPLTPDEATDAADAWAKYFDQTPEQWKQAFEERLRLERAYAERVIKKGEVALPKPVQSDRVAYAKRILEERDEG